MGGLVLTGCGRSNEGITKPVLTSCWGLQKVLLLKLLVLTSCGRSNEGISKPVLTGCEWSTEGIITKPVLTGCGGRQKVLLGKTVTGLNRL